MTVVKVVCDTVKVNLKWVPVQILRKLLIFFMTKRS
jgi:hypothetical protein